jgi:hypothetical protein
VAVLPFLQRVNMHRDPLSNYNEIVAIESAYDCRLRSLIICKQFTGDFNHINTHPIHSRKACARQILIGSNDMQGIL